MRVTTLLAATVLVALPLLPPTAMAQQTAYNTVGGNARLCVDTASGAVRLYSPKMAANGHGGPLAKACGAGELNLPYQPVIEVTPQANNGGSGGSAPGPQGPAGPQGAQGPQGEQGPPGDGGKNNT